ncbi:MAG: sensor histidine kinase [Micrococcales bacterium]|nr:sensor histidine kinase [Micrococcales bacterium]
MLPTAPRLRGRARLVLLAVGLPVAFLVAIQLLRPIVVARLGDHAGHLLVGAIVVSGAIAFGLVAVSLIEANRRLIVAHQQELAAHDQLALSRAHATRVAHERECAIRAERDRIAREMHDSLAQVLGVTQLRLRALSGAGELGESARAEVDDLADLARDAYRDVREAILGLRTAGGERLTFVEALSTYVAAFSRQSGVQTTLETGGIEPALSPTCEVEVIRVVQEALTNVRKHAGAAAATVRLTETPMSLSIVVEDDGRGFDPRVAAGDGYGLFAMRERVAQSGGTLVVDSRPGAGTRVTVRIPSTCRVESTPAREATA